jgi:hypothetical protein
MTLIFALVINSETKEITAYITPKSYFAKYHYLSDKFRGNSQLTNWELQYASKFKWTPTNSKEVKYAIRAFQNLLDLGFQYSEELTKFLDKHKASMYDVTYKPRKKFKQILLT